MRFRNSLIIENANIRTLDPTRLFAHSIGIHNGLIKALDGDFSDSGHPGARCAGDHTPGFIDTHAHFTAAGMTMMAINLEGCTTIPEVLERLSKDAAGKSADYLVFATQFAPDLLSENRFPTANELDRAVGNQSISWSVLVTGPVLTRQV
jgi:predicted amidohydrolase YtcJ